jgi:hypothetical protein
MVPDTVDSRETTLPSGTHSRTRILYALPLLILAACFATASAGSSNTPGCQGRPKLSNFDYLVLASIADSSRLPAMASYRPMGMQHSVPSLLDRSAEKHYSQR